MDPRTLINLWFWSSFSSILDHLCIFIDFVSRTYISWSTKLHTTYLATWRANGSKQKELTRKKIWFSLFFLLENVWFMLCIDKHQGLYKFNEKKKKELKQKTMKSHVLRLWAYVFLCSLNTLWDVYTYIAAVVHIWAVVFFICIYLCRSILWELEN